MGGQANAGLGGASGNRPMNEEFACELCRLNERFYESQSASFSATRASSWEGWGRVAEAARSLLGGADAHVAGSLLRVFDVACGNLRFERFLASEFPDAELRCVAVDNCEELLPVDLPDGVRFKRMDVMDKLRRGRLFATWGEGADPATEGVGRVAMHDAVDGGFFCCDSAAVDACEGSGPDMLKRDFFDLAVCFGFLHHVPLEAWRTQLLDALIDAARPGGLVVVSLWRFMDNARLAEKARRTTAEALERLGWQDRADELDAGDFLLGWQNVPGAYRYCHSFSDADVDALAATDVSNPQASLVARFRADGRTHDLNEYLIFRKR